MGSTLNNTTLNWLNSKGFDLKKIGILSVYMLLCISIYMAMYDRFMQHFWRWRGSEKVASIVDSIIGYYPNILVEFPIPHYDWSIFLSSFQNPFLLIYLLILSLFIFKKWLWVTWKEINLSRYFKYFIFCLALILTWTYATYDYNLYYDRAHLLDRLILIGVAFVILRTPLAVFYFLPLCLIMISQFYLPLGGYSMTDKLLLFNLLFIFSSWMIVYSICKLNWGKVNIDWVQTLVSKGLDQTQILLLLMVVVFGAAYFLPFMKKVIMSPNLIDYPFLEQFDIAVAKYFNRGWLEPVSSDLKTAIISFIELLSTPLLIIAFIIEGLSVFLFAGRRTAQWILGSFIVLHMAIFSLSGIFFWKWSLANLFFLLFLGIYTNAKIFSDLNYKLVGTTFILLSWFLINSPKLGWFSFELSNHYSMSVETENGTIYVVNPNDMSPYYMFFSFTSRWNLYDGNVISASTTETDLLDLFNSADESEKRRLIEGDLGIVTYTPEFYSTYRSFLERYFTLFNERMSKKVFLSYIPNIYHVYLWEDYDGAFQFDEKIRSISVNYERCYYDNGHEKTCENHNVMNMNIPQ